VMQFVQGRILRDPTLPGLSPSERRAIYDEMVRVLAELHLVDWQRAGLADFGKPGGYVARQISRWTKQYEASQTVDVPSMTRLVEWLPSHVPDDDTTTIA